MSDEAPDLPPNQPVTSAPVTGPPQTSGLAIASLCLGLPSIPLIFFCVGWITAITGLILGIIALVKIKDSNGQVKGKGMAISGIITSVVAVIIYGIFIAWLATTEMGQGEFNIESSIEKAIEEAEAEAEAAKDAAK